MTRQKTERFMIEALLDMGITSPEDSARLARLLQELDRGLRLRMMDQAWLASLYEECLK